MTESESTDLARTAPAVLDQEIRLIRDAIAMVAGGHAPRVTVASIQFADRLLEPATTWAAEAGVRIVPLWRTDESGLDLTVEAAS